MVQEVVGDHFRRHIAIPPGVSSHDVTKHMHGDENRLAVSGVQIKTVQYEADKGLHILCINSRLTFTVPGVPLE